jgi:Ribonuclease toxin, BrnT, of type II toxin-antitoxin system
LSPTITPSAPRRVFACRRQFCFSAGHENLDRLNLRGHKDLVRISYDRTKREATLAQRGLDFEDAAKVFDGVTLTLLDDRHDYGERRFQTYGLLGQRLVNAGLDTA